MRSAPSSRRRATAAGTTAGGDTGPPGVDDAEDGPRPGPRRPAPPAHSPPPGRPAARSEGDHGVSRRSAPGRQHRCPSQCHCANAGDITAVDLVHVPEGRPPSPAAASSSARRRRTAAGSSPTCSARFPAPASVKATHTPGRTSARQQNNHNTAILPKALALHPACHDAADLLEEVRDIQVIGVAAGQVRLHDGRQVDVEAGVSRDCEGRCWPQPP